MVLGVFPGDGLPAPERLLRSSGGASYVALGDAALVFTATCKAVLVTRRWRVLRHRVRVVEALALLVVARVARLVIPMRRWALVLGGAGAARVVVDATATPRRVEVLVAAAVESAARHVPANCLDKAVAASLMLRQRDAPSVVVIGLNRDQPTDVPHAWVVGPSGNVVVGEAEMHGFRPVSQFGG